MKDMAQVLHSLKDTLKDDQKWMDKYNSLEAIPEDGDEKVTEGRIEVLEYVIKQIEDALYENVQVTKHGWTEKRCLALRDVPSKWQN